MPDALYRSYSLEKDSNGISGSLTYYNDSPSSSFDVGDSFRPVSSGPLLNVSRVSIKDNVIGIESGKVKRQWQITVEGSTDSVSATSSSSSDIRYKFTIEDNKNSGSMEVVNKGNSPAISLNIGDTFNIPGIGQVICTQVSGSDDYNDNGSHTWTVTYEGSSNVDSDSDDPDNPDKNLPNNEETISYELNGSTVRTVAGELIVLRRSATPITRKNITVYTDSANSVATIGSTYNGGIALSESIAHEVIKSDGVITNSYYKHDIEVES